MSEPIADMAKATLWASILPGDGEWFLDGATIDGRPLTDDERALAGAATLADLEAARVLRQARLVGLDIEIAGMEALVVVLAPWWEGDTTLDEALALAPAGVRAEAQALLDVMAGAA